MSWSWNAWRAGVCLGIGVANIATLLTGAWGGLLVLIEFVLIGLVAVDLARAMRHRERP